MSRFGLRTRTGLIYNIIQGAMGSTTDADAQAFFDRVTAAGGTLSATEKDAVNNLVLDLKANSLWSSMVAIYPMVGASAAACAQNLKSSLYTGTFSGGITYASTGVTGNGTSGYMTTGLSASVAATQNSSHMSFYSRTTTAASTAAAMGGYTSTPTTNYFHMHPYYTGNLMYSLLASSTAVSVANTSSLGFFNGNRNSSTNVSNFKNGTNLGNVTMSSVALSTYNIAILAYNDTGNISNYSIYQCAFASIGLGLTDTQAATFYTNVQTFQTSLSRNV